MPQMAPLNWLTLMMYFIMIFIVFNTINYFSFSYSPQKKSSLKEKTKKIAWKW
uniref:ATP synthase complex subunit 8 n=1 Tax=Tenebrionoidea sp. 9 KM-2017 TaxID=2219487 RepID=A0A346RKG6_9CUCU|nr:ATP synthase F0 subunit 8 [Tenebrionoidea sp. 9 KM-2017]